MENKLVGMLVAIIAFIFVAAYILVFGSNPTSTDPEDWAYFATYLSGTVGVTAVLGTLYAVVRTLRQQQALIDSQKDMLEKQERQLELAQKQLDGEERRRQVELAYNCAVNIIPPVVKELERHRAMRLDTFLDGLELLDIIPDEIDTHQSIGDVFRDEGEYEWLMEIDKSYGCCIGQCLTANAYRLGVLVSDCLYEAKELEDYFQSIIGKENFRMIEFAMLFMKNSINSGFNRHQLALRIVDGKQSRPVIQFWYDLGERSFTD